MIPSDKGATRSQITLQIEFVFKLLHFLGLGGAVFVGFHREDLNQNHIAQIVISILIGGLLYQGWNLAKMVGQSTGEPGVLSKAGHALAFLIPNDRREEFLGDLAERYNVKLKRFGKATADRWYLRQLLTSIGPLLLAAIKRTVQMTVEGVRSAARRGIR